MAEQNAGFIEHHVAHHFESAEQEFDAAKLGMWLFLATEVLLFGGLFVAYTVFRVFHPEMFQDSSAHLSWKMGGLNTIILITSSFTMAMGVRTAQVNSRQQEGKGKLLIFLGLTVLFALGFLVVKYFEYSEKFQHGYLPGNFFSGSGQFETMHVFFGIYFFMTGIHGLHVLIGMGLILWIMVKAGRGTFYNEYFTPVELVGLYWHLVDLIWIFLFPLLYLI